MRNRKKEKNGRFRNLGKAIKMEIREHKSSAIVYLTLRALVLIMMVLQFFNQKYVLIDPSAAGDTKLYTGYF